MGRRLRSCEDPRVVETADGRYTITYTAYDGKTDRLCVATSNDLIHWTKHGLAFGEENAACGLNRVQLCVGEKGVNSRLFPLAGRAI